jgi:hypothetical protein
MTINCDAGLRKVLEYDVEVGLFFFFGFSGVFLFYLFIHLFLFICAYNVWVISPPSPQSGSSECQKNYL